MNPNNQPELSWKAYRTMSKHNVLTKDFILSPLLSTPPSNLVLQTGELHIWCADLDQNKSRVHNLEHLLSIDERIRAKRFHFDQHRKRYISGLGILRTILGRYLGIETNLVRFRSGKNGKPSLSETNNKGDIRFNMSHSEEIAVFAFTRDREIGVDIERIHDIPDKDLIVERFFSVREKNVFYTLPESKKKEAFFNCWTRKEAFLKAIGEGLYRPLDKFTVSLAPDEPARLLNIEEDPKEASRWTIQDLIVADGFASAFAVEGRSCQHHYCWLWSD